MGGEASIPEYDLHPRGARVDDALAMFGRIVAEARSSGTHVFAVVTGYGSSGGTSRIKESVLARCRRFKTQNHIRGFLDGEYAADYFSSQCLAFPDAWAIPARYRRSPNPGVVFVSV